MKRVDLVKVEHSVKVGDVCGPIDPNVCEDSIFYEDGEPVGFYLSDMGRFNPKLNNLADVANAELRSERVPKSTMKRSSGLTGGAEHEVLQYSTIIGSVPPKPHMRRIYPTMSSVHSVKSAETFIKAMLALCREGEDVIQELMPSVFEQQCQIIKDKIPEKWRFGRMFTSSISNFNISAPFHRDAANLIGCVNIIIAKKWRADGGNTTVPDYGATVDSRDNSMLVYPAWRNVHGVTPIEVRMKGGYRNSLVFYPLKAFQNCP